jgi:hypothetical protein
MRKDWLKFVALLLPVLTGCLSHTRKLVQPKMAGPVMNADALHLVAGINQRYGQINSLKATVDFAASVGGARLGKRTDYTSLSGILLFRKPQMLRVLGLVPVLHTRAFDLASNGTNFTLLIPPRGRALQGTNAVTKPAANPMENMRPSLFLDAMLVQPISPDQIVSIINESDTSQDPKTKKLVELPEYDLTVLSEETPPAVPGLAKVARPLRVIRFGRVNLLPVELDIYNESGDLETQVKYGPYQDFDGFAFPSTIDIDRPLDEFRVVLTIEKLAVNPSNPPLADDQFQMKIPDGYQLEKLE